MYAESACARDPVHDHLMSKLSGQPRKIATPVIIRHLAQVGRLSFRPGASCQGLAGKINLFMFYPSAKIDVDG